MQFRYVRQVDGEVNCYGKMVKTGDIVEFEGHLAAKAQKNPDFEAVTDRPDLEVVPKKPGPKPKVKGGDEG